MTVTTNKPINPAQLMAQLPAGTVLSSMGAEMELAGEKTLTADVTDDVLQAAVNAAVAIFVDPFANRDALLAKAAAAIDANKAFLALPDPTTANQTFLSLSNPTNAQVIAQVRALTQQSNALIAQARKVTRQNDALIRLTLGLLDESDG